MPEPGVSIVLIIFRERAQTDFPAVLQEIADAGYQAIEGGNLYAQHGADQARRLLDGVKLGISGAHFGYGDYADPEKLSANIAYAKAASVPNLICSGVAGNNIEGFKESARVFNEVGKRAAAEGIKFNYHNHAWELDDLGGTCGMEILAQETDPAYVGFNMDVYWLYYGLVDPAAFIRKHADRAGYYHFKDGKRVVEPDGKVHAEFLPLGQGDVDLKAAMQAARECDPKWIVMEQDSTTLPHAEAIRISRNYMRDSLGLP
jgi:sugar phosphate isomerase/epimerase